MSDYIVRTNNVPRFTVDAWELSPKERYEFDYIDWPAVERGDANPVFVRYKGWTHHLGDVMRVDDVMLPADSPLRGWHGYVSDSFFSGVLFRFTDDCESVVCGRFSC